VDLTGKLAVVTGASRGNGRAIGEALANANVDVIGTSRDPKRVPSPPGFPLLALDVADPLSVASFPVRLAATPLYRKHAGSVDILANNAGRFVLGEVVPRPGTSLVLYTAQRELGVRTLYTGHVMLTNVMLPLMSKTGYSRIIFTASVASYYTGSTIPAATGMDVYAASKAALRTYATNLGSALSQTSIRVSAVNPYVMNTALAEHPNPIYTQPVNSSGLSPDDDVFNGLLGAVRSLLAHGQPPSRVGDTYVQLLQMTTPPPNVVVGSPLEPLATQGQNQLIESQVLAENDTSGMRLVSA
jgi:NAD(P)-dependent dehydrogenase (short-subunit alcohol dehydrogenase family)